MKKSCIRSAIGVRPARVMATPGKGPTPAWRTRATPRVWELATLVTRYDGCMDDGDALTPIDLSAAVENYWQAVEIKELIYAEATRFGVPLPYTGFWQDDLRILRAFIAGGGWQ